MFTKKSLCKETPLESTQTNKAKNTSSTIKTKTLAKKAPDNFPTTTNATSRITIKYNAGFPNSLYIRGSGADLCWERGLLLKNISSDEWVFETDIPFKNLEFKILFNDITYEKGENHILTFGSHIQLTPDFF